MRVKFPDGSGGPFLVPGVGPVNGGEEFDWPDGEPPVAGAVPVEAAAAEGAGEAPGGSDQDGEDEAATGRKAASKGSAR